MPLIFIGGARGSGKTTLIRALKRKFPQVEHVGLAREVTRITAPVMYHEEYVGMRRLTPEQQHEAAAKVIQNLAQKNQADPAKIIFVDGHFVSSSYLDNHESFVSFLGKNVQFFEKMIWVKIEPHQILYRRYKRERLARPMDLTVREYFAEGIEASMLEKQFGSELLKCTDEEFFDVVYAHFGGYLRASARTESFSSQFKVEAVLRVLRGDGADAISQEFGVTVETLSRWLHRFVAAGSAEFTPRNLRSRARDVAQLKSIIGEMIKESEVLPDANPPPMSHQWQLNWK